MAAFEALDPPCKHTEFPHAGGGGAPALHRKTSHGGGDGEETGPPGTPTGHAGPVPSFKLVLALKLSPGALWSVRGDVSPSSTLGKVGVFMKKGNCFVPTCAWRAFILYLKKAAAAPA